MKSKLPIFVAIVIAIVALIAIRSYVNKKQKEIEDKYKGAKVVAAAVDIPAGTELSRGMITALEVPNKSIPVQAIQGAEQAKLILGRKTRVDMIKKGHMILWSDLALETRGGLSSIIPAGEGAFTISISRGIKPGLIQPSDRIDILASFAVPKSTQPIPDTVASWRQGSDMVNVVLLQNVTVLAVGESFDGSGQSSGGQGGDLTLALTLPEAQLLMFASQHGELGAILRREGSIEVAKRDDLPRVTFEAIEKIVGDLDGRRSVRIVEIQKGFKKEQVPIKAATGQGELP